MRSVIGSVLKSGAAAILAAALPAAWGFDCGITRCICHGQQDCIQMRHSGQCASDSTCSGGGDSVSCECPAFRTANPGNGGTGNDSGIQRPPNEAPPPTSAKPP